MKRTLLISYLLAVTPTLMYSQARLAAQPAGNVTSAAQPMSPAPVLLPTLSKNEFGAKVNKLSTQISLSDLDMAKVTFDQLEKEMLSELSNLKTKIRYATDAQKPDEKGFYEEILKKQQDTYNTIEKIKPYLAGNQDELNDKFIQFAVAKL